jgi:hypothetical protein
MMAKVELFEKDERVSLYFLNVLNLPEDFCCHYHSNVVY